MFENLRWMPLPVLWWKRAIQSENQTQADSLSVSCWQLQVYFLTTPHLSQAGVSALFINPKELNNSKLLKSTIWCHEFLLKLITANSYAWRLKYDLVTTRLPAVVRMIASKLSGIMSLDSSQLIFHLLLCLPRKGKTVCNSVQFPNITCFTLWSFG